VHLTRPDDPHSGDTSKSGPNVGVDQLYRVGHWLAALALIGLPILGLLFWADDWLRSQRLFMSGKDWSVVASAMSASANGSVLIPAILGLVLWFRVRGQQRMARAWMGILFAGVVAGCVGTTFRTFIGRTRPEVPVEQGWFGPRKDGQWILGRHAYSAFPSGHASIAAGVGFMAFVWGRRAGWMGVAYAMAVAWARFHLGAHRASDVWAGLLVGAMTVAFLWPSCSAWVHRGNSSAWWPWSSWFLEETPNPTRVDPR
jgi:membrane-associated phospholipid phosphatase